LNDEKMLQNMMMKAGFKNVKTFFWPMMSTFFSGEELIQFWSQGPAFAAFDAETAAAIKKEFVEEYNLRFGEGSDEFLDFEILVAIGEK
jgi:hypothetical protein